MKVAILYSGGKDSNLALLKTAKHFKVACLVSLIPESEEAYLFHYPNVHLVRLQAEALNIPLLQMKCPNDEEGSLKTLYRILEEAKKKFKIEGVVTGAVRSTYQASRFQSVCWDLDLWCFNPNWLKDEIKLLEEILNLGFEVIFTRVAGYPLKKNLLGRKLTREVIEYFKRIRNFINPSGEGGEYETLVLDMPLFKKKIEILDWEVIGEDYDATMIIKEARLVDK